MRVALTFHRARRRSIFFCASAIFSPRSRVSGSAFVSPWFSASTRRGTLAARDGDGTGVDAGDGDGVGDDDALSVVAAGVAVLAASETTGVPVARPASGRRLPTARSSSLAYTGFHSNTLFSFHPDTLIFAFHS